MTTEREREAERRKQRATERAAEQREFEERERLWKPRRELRADIAWGVFYGWLLTLALCAALAVLVLWVWAVAT